MLRKTVPLLLVAALGAAWILIPRSVERLSAQSSAGAKQKKLPKLLAAKPLDVEGAQDEMTRLLRERYNAAVEEVRERYRQFQTSSPNIEPMFDALRRLLASGAAAVATGRNRIDFLSQYLELTRDLAAQTEKLAKNGTASRAEAAQARYMVLDARIQVLHAQRRLAGPGGLQTP